MERLRRFSLGQNQDITLAFLIVGILVVLVVPIPPFLLDILLSLNISLAVVVLLATIYLQKPTDFQVFPSLLLVLTLYRLSLNVASTRLILAQADAGSVIDSFGTIVTAGNYIVGAVIFTILVIIQFVVITRGATRISEVAARFTLDAMPGKQMGVDADLNAGLITEEQARSRRQEIEREADFYGAMDGATKFVRGAVIAGPIITVVNIIGGFIVGIAMLGLDFSTAVTTYTRLTIGDGLVSQVPALIISLSAGVIVTRTASDANLGADLGQQLSRYPRALGVGAIMLAGLAVFPGLPMLPFMATAALLGFLAVTTGREITRQTEEAEFLADEEEKAEAAAEPERTEELLVIDPLKIELGYGLIYLADPKQGGDLLSRVQIIRQQMATKMGFIVPVVRIVDNMRLRPNEYRVRMREAEVARYELYPGHVLAMNPGIAEAEIEGIPTEEPAFGLQAIWVPDEQRDRAERLGYTIVEPSAVLATHLTEVIMNFSAEILSRQDVQTLSDNLKESSPSVVAELLPDVLTLGEVQKVLQLLLRERVSIRNLETIYETLADFGKRTKDPEVLAEYSRHALARQVCSEYTDDEGHLLVVTLSPEIEAEILEAVRVSETGEYIPLPPERADEIARKSVQALQPLVSGGHDPIVLTSAQARRYAKRIIERLLPRVIVLSYNEIDPAVQLDSEGQVTA
jgi:flagellar biosynthesis protein FlhA